MSDNIRPFPKGRARRDRLNLRKHRVPCQVSPRWLQFPESADALPEGDFMRVDVMTLGADESERRLCELVLTKQDLFEMLNQIEASEKNP